MSNMSAADDPSSETPNDTSGVMLEYVKKAALEVTKLLRQVSRDGGIGWEQGIWGGGGGGGEERGGQNPTQPHLRPRS